MAANGNGNGSIRNWIAGIGILVSLTLAGLSVMRDTPTRQEMETKDREVEARLQATISEMSSRLVRIENLLLEERRARRDDR